MGNTGSATTVLAATVVTTAGQSTADEAGASDQVTARNMVVFVRELFISPSS